MPVLDVYSVGDYIGRMRNCTGRGNDYADFLCVRNMHKEPHRKRQRAICGSLYSDVNARIWRES